VLARLSAPLPQHLAVPAPLHSRICGTAHLNSRNCGTAPYQQELYLYHPPQLKGRIASSSMTSVSLSRASPALQLSSAASEARRAATSAGSNGAASASGTPAGGAAGAGWLGGCVWTGRQAGRAAARSATHAWWGTRRAKKLPVAPPPAGVRTKPSPRARRRRRHRDRHAQSPRTHLSAGPAASHA